jgi:hypothetical protein
MKHTMGLLAVIATGLLLALPPARAEEKPFTEGSVWAITLVRVKAGMLDTYLHELVPLRKRLNDEAKKAGLLVSSHILSGGAANRDDFDVMFLDEFKNWAAFDGLSAKYEALEDKLIGSEDKRTQLMVKRTEVREITGNKLMQELMPK